MGGIYRLGTRQPGPARVAGDTTGWPQTAHRGAITIPIQSKRIAL